MIEITKDKLIISLETEDPETCLENLRDAVFNALKHMSRLGGESNPDPEGLNVYLLELLEATEKKNSFVIGFTLNEVKNEAAKKRGYKDWDDLSKSLYHPDSGKKGLNNSLDSVIHDIIGIVQVKCAG